jgi:hypothetical protein
MFHPLKDYLEGALRRTGAARSVKASVIVEAAGPLINNMIPALRPSDWRVVSYRDGRLTIAVANSVVAQELRLRREPLMDVLRDTFPDHRFEYVRIVPLIDDSNIF